MSARLWCVVLVCLVAVVGCADEGPSGPAADCKNVTGAVTVVAQNLAFDSECLQVKRGEKVTITFDNRDRAVVHDLVIDGPSGSFRTELLTGPAKERLLFEATELGEHRFVCEPHSQAMYGTLWVV